MIPLPSTFATPGKIRLVANSPLPTVLFPAVIILAIKNGKIVKVAGSFYNGWEICLFAII
jgi:hypothetical protein